MNSKMLDLKLFKKCFWSPKMWILRIIMMILSASLIFIGVAIDAYDSQPIPIVLDESSQHLRQSIEVHSNLFKVCEEGNNFLRIEDGVFYLELNTNKYKKFKVENELMYIAIQELNSNKHDEFKFEFNKTISPEITTVINPVLFSLLCNWIFIAIVIILLRRVLSVSHDYIAFKKKQDRSFKYKQSVFIIINFELLLLIGYILMLSTIVASKTPHVTSKLIHFLKQSIPTRELLIKQILVIIVLIPICSFVMELFFSERKLWSRIITSLLLVFIFAFQLLLLKSSITVIEFSIFIIVSILIIITLEKTTTAFLVS